MAGQKSYRQKVRDIRPFSRRNPDGTFSTVLFEQADNYAYPTIFPVDPNDPESGWLELHGEEAFNEARNRGELFSFDSEEEARLFAEGSWKNLEEKPTSKSIDDIIKSSDVTQFLSAAMSDKTNTDTPYNLRPDISKYSSDDPLDLLFKMKNTERKSRMTPDEFLIILKEAQAYSLRQEVEQSAQKYLKQNPKLDLVTAYQWGYNEWIK